MGAFFPYMRAAPPAKGTAGGGGAAEIFQNKNLYSQVFKWGVNTGSKIIVFRKIQPDTLGRFPAPTRQAVYKGLAACLPLYQRTAFSSKARPIAPGPA